MKTSSVNYFFILSVLYIFGIIHNDTKAQGYNPFGDDVKKILFLGNSITYGGGYISDIETYFKISFPDKKYDFINAGLPSETVSGLSESRHIQAGFPRPDLHERLDRVLTSIKPDVAFVCYGINDGIYMPFDEERFKKYKDGMLWLYSELKKNGVKRIVVITPPVHDDKEKGLDGYNTVLDKYTDWLLCRQKDAGWEVIDVHYDMKSFLLNERKKNPHFRLADDGIHPNGLGHWLMARKILSGLGQHNVESIPTMQDFVDSIPEAKNIYKLVLERQSFMKDAWLTYTKHSRPGLPVGIPISEAKERYDAIEGKIAELLPLCNLSK